MNVTILCVGKPKTEFFEAAIQTYVKRLRRWADCRIEVVPASNIEQESARILSCLPSGSIAVLLDETGVLWSTPDLAAHIDTWQNQSIKKVTFIIGGAYGVTDTLKRHVDAIWSLSPLVFPHEQARLMVCEQLYRAYDVLHDGNYHHA